MIRIIGVRSTFAFFTLAAVALAAVAYLNARTTLETRSTASVDTRLPVVAIPGYRLRVFTTANATNGKWKDAPKVSNPDSVVVSSGRVFIDYQNVTAKDGSDGKSSTVVEYNMQGEPLKRWDVPGHSDGMRMNPATHVLWTTSNEDGNPAFATVDPSSDKVTKYTFPAPPHQGGYDDLYFLNGKAFIAASNPTLDSSGNNVFPAVDLITLNDSNHNLAENHPHGQCDRDGLDLQPVRNAQPHRPGLSFHRRQGRPRPRLTGGLGADHHFEPG